jgi:hypothetical protein
VFRATPETVVVKEVVEAEKPTTGSVQVKGAPAGGRVYVDDQLVGEGAEVVAADVQPGEHALRVEAEGYEPWTDKVTVAAGERVRQPVSLKPVRVARPSGAGSGASTPPSRPSESKGAAEKGTLAFTSSPSGANVLVNGKFAGSTPFEWDGDAGARVSVEYRLDGYDSARFNANVPSGGGRQTYDKTLQARAAGEGKLSVNVSGGWAEVYVDGKKIGTTPIMSTLPAGAHEVRVKRDDIGLDQHKTVTVSAGQTATAAFSAN